MKISINNLNINENKIQDEFKKNLKKIVQKIGSSRKTKVVHKLIDNGLCQLGYGASNLTKDNIVLGSVISTGDKLNAIILDITKFVDGYDKSSVAKKIDDLKELQKEYSASKRTISDLTEYKITTLEKHIDEAYQEIIDTVDYFKLVDGYFHMFMKFLSERAMDTRGKNKILPEMLNFMSEVMSKLVQKTKSLTHDEYHEFSKAVEYAFLRTYNNTNHKAAYTRVKGIETETEKYSDFYNDLKELKFNEFSDIAILLTKRDIIGITPNGLKNLIKKTGGTELVNSLDGDLSDLMAYLVSTNYQNQLFDGYQINKEAQGQLEDYILNFKKNITYSKR